MPMVEQAPTSLGSIRAGEKIGRYLVIERLGAGGLSVVLTAYDPQLDRRIALKLLRGDEREGPNADDGQRRLLREAQAMAKLQHPNVVTVHDVGTHAGAVYIAMELVAGKTVGAWMREHDAPRSWPEVLRVFEMAGRGLAAAHAHGLVHRDFKPDNVMLGDDGIAKVMDFGLVRAEQRDVTEPMAAVQPGRVVEAAPSGEADVAREAMQRVRERLASLGKLEGEPSFAADATLPAPAAEAPTSSEPEAFDPLPSDAPLTKTGAVMGTPAYMAPEQIAGAAVDGRTDQFAFCVALWEALYGVRPFVGETWPELAAKISRADPPTAPRSNVPTWLRDLVLRGLARDPAQRHPDMTSLLAQSARRQQRGRRTAGGLALAGLAAVAVASWSLRGDGPACEDAAAGLSAHYDEAVADRVSAALGAIDRGFASDTAGRVVARLDGYADEYRAAAQRACTAHRVDRSISDTLFDRRMACLTTRADALGTLAGALVDPTPDDLEHAVAAAAGLPSIATCEDASVLLAEIEPPADDATATAVAALRHEIVQVSTATALGRYAEAVAYAAGLDARATSTGYGPVEAELALAAGQALDRAGNTEGAIESLSRAAFRGRESRHDRVAAEAEVWLTFVVAAHARDAARAQWWAASAEAAVLRAPRHEVLAARSKWHRGVAATLAGRPDEGLELLAAAADELDAELGRDHPDAIEAAYNLAVARRRSGDLKGALALQTDVLQRRRALLGPAHPEVGRSLEAIGVIEESQGDHVRAAATLREALAVLEGALGPDHPLVAGACSDLAASLRHGGDLDEALRQWERARTIYTAAFGPAHPNVARVDHNLGVTFAELDRFDEAITAYERALAIRQEALGPSHPDVVRTREALAGTRRRAADPEP
jgi:serine/threonine protein kinase/tetratricopeptide (TPR) repeat protein